MQNRADIRFTDAGELRDEPVVDVRAELERYELALAIRQARGERRESRKIGVALCVPVAGLAHDYHSAAAHARGARRAAERFANVTLTD